MYQREHFFRLVKNGLEVVFNLISENQNAETLQFDLSKCERIKIEYTSPSFVGVKTLTTQKYGGNYYEIVGENKIKIVLSNLHNAPYLLNGVAYYGSYTLSICSLQIDVPSNVSQGTQDLGEITQVVVKSFEIGGGDLGLYPEPGEIIQTIRSAFDPNTKYVGTIWRKFIDGIYFSSGNTFEYRGEQLPNIKGAIKDMYLKGDKYTVTMTGALKKSTITNNSYGGTREQAGTVLTGIDFNASYSSSIYKDKGKVRPNTITTYSWIRVDGLSQEEMSALESYLV